jgi:hypothetical protein
MFELFPEMNYEQFLQKLKQSDFKVVGLSFAFRNFGDWQIAFIRLNGKFQSQGKIAFVICARPINAKGLDGKIIKESKVPHDYPFKLIPSEIGEELKYQSKTLNYPLEYFDRDGDWSNLYEILLTKLPQLLDKLRVDGLKRQIRLIKDLGYIEKIWLEN